MTSHRSVFQFTFLEEDSQVHARVFRLLVVASLGLHFSFVMLPHVSSAPTNLSTVLDWNGFGGLPLLQHPAFYVTVLATKAVATLALLVNIGRGRWLQLAFVTMVVSTLPLSGLSVLLPLESLVGGLAALLDGAILGLAFGISTPDNTPGEASP